MYKLFFIFTSSLFVWTLSISSVYASEKHSAQSFSSLFDEVEKNITDNQTQRAVYTIELIDNMYPSMKEPSYKAKYIDLLSKVSIMCVKECMYVQALKLAYKGIDYSNDNRHYKSLPELYKTAGNVMNLYDEVDYALKYYYMGLERSIEEKDYSNLTKILLNMLSLNYLNHNSDDIISSWNKIDDLMKGGYIEKNDTLQFAEYYTKAVLLTNSQSYDSALTYYQLTENIINESGLSIYFSVVINEQIALLYENINNIDSAKRYYMKNIEIANDYNIFDVPTFAYKQLSAIARDEGNYKDAYYYQNKFLTLHDSIYNLSHLRQIELNRFEHNEKNNQSIINQLKDTNATKTKWIGISIYIVLSLICVVFWIYRQKRKLTHAYQNLYSVNQELLKYKEQDKNYPYTIIEKQKATDINETLLGEIENSDSSLNKEIINKEEIKAIIDKIDQCMRDKSIFCNPDFNLEQLASYVGISSKTLSQFINDTYGQNFRSFISDYRIREAQHMLSNTEVYSNYTIQAIGEAVGYRSSSTFFTLFKEKTGLTPAMYQQLSMIKKK